MHPPPPSSIHLHPAHFNLHPGHFSLDPVLSNTLDNIWAKILHLIEQLAISPNLDWKIQSCLLWLKIATNGILVVLIPIPDLNVWNSERKIHFWSNLSIKSLICFFFAWKLAQIVSEGCWFTFQHWFYEFPSLNCFLGKFGHKMSKLLVLPEN